MGAIRNLWSFSVPSPPSKRDRAGSDSDFFQKKSACFRLFVSSTKCNIKSNIPRCGAPPCPKFNRYVNYDMLLHIQKKEIAKNIFLFCRFHSKNAITFASYQPICLYYNAFLLFLSIKHQNLTSSIIFQTIYPISPRFC